MKKIRINELARELEVKPGVILDMLPGLGVQEKKTHSSSVDEDVALELRRKLTGSSAPFKFASGYTNGHHEDDQDDDNLPEDALASGKPQPGESQASKQHQLGSNLENNEQHERSAPALSAGRTPDVRREQASPSVTEPTSAEASLTERKEPESREPESREPESREPEARRSESQAPEIEASSGKPDGNSRDSAVASAEGKVQADVAAVSALPPQARPTPPSIPLPPSSSAPSIPIPPAKAVRAEATGSPALTAKAGSAGPLPEAPKSAVLSPKGTSEPLKGPRQPFTPPVRTTFKDEARPPFPVRNAPVMPRPPASNAAQPPAAALPPSAPSSTQPPPTSAHVPAATSLSPGAPAQPPAPAPGPAAPSSAPGSAVPPEAPEGEKPAVSFRPPLRPPIGGGAIHPPLASPSQPPSPGLVNRSLSIPVPARPVPNAPVARPAQTQPAPPIANPTPVPPGKREGGAPTLSGPRQPLPPEPTRPSPVVPLPPSTAERSPERSPDRARPDFSRPSAPVTPVPPISTRSSHPTPPTHLVAPGAGGQTSSVSGNNPSSSSANNPGNMPVHQPTQGGPSMPPAMPGAPRPSLPPNRPESRGLTPNAPIAPRPGTRPLAGQPQVRPVVPPRPDLVQRLKQQQTRPTAPLPAIPRPGTPARPSPAPGQPLYTRPPSRPGAPAMRPPGQAYVPPGTLPPGIRRPGTSGPRPPHPTSLRPESAQPLPTEQQRRHTPKPGQRNAGRKREREEGNLRERVSKRSLIAELPPIDREITVAEGITVKELSEKLGVKANLVVKKLVEKKIFATINQTMDVKLAEELARDFGASTNQVSYEQESTQDLEQTEIPADFVRRAPVVTIMGHVDHGKTSLLDAIRETNVAGREAGGITQHIGAYHIERNNRKIVFIDTPGHQAFTRMRARGAKITDIVVLVVSADDGVMPQTLEAIDHAKAAGVPMIVAINKIDKPDATPERVKQQLADRGLLAEDWGGDTVMTPVSAKTGQNLDLLLEMILLVADLQDLKANPNRPALGNVLEAKLDKGRGPVATMLVRNGTLRVGDFFICGSLFSKVRAMFDDRGNPVREAEPSMPVEVIGLEALPEVGDSFQVTSDTSKAKQIVIYREAKARDAAMAKGARVATLDSLHQQFKEGDLKDLNLIIKADVGGTAEVLSDTLQGLSTDKIRVRVLHAGVGAISESDVLLASTSEALIIGFNVKPDRSAESAAQQAKVEIRQHNIIYELIDEVKLAMAGLQDPVYKETVQGHIEVKEVFKISKVGTVAGCYVSDGLVRRDSQVRVRRDGDLIHTGKIEALKRFKNDASEVKSGIECGISLQNFNNIEIGDIFESFTMERIMPELPVPLHSR